MQMIPASKRECLAFYNMTRELKERGIIAIGVVESVYRNIKSENQYVLRCRKRSVLDDERLKKCWQRKDSQKDLVVVDFCITTRLAIPLFRKYASHNADWICLQFDTKLPSISLKDNISKLSKGLSMRKILISIKPNYVKGIFRGEKNMSIANACRRM